MNNPCADCTRDEWCTHYCAQYRAWFAPVWDETVERIWRYVEKQRRYNAAPVDERRQAYYDAIRKKAREGQRWTE